MRTRTSILVVLGLLLAGPVPSAVDCDAQTSCCCPHEAPGEAGPSAGAPSACCDVADGTLPAPTEPMVRDLPQRLTFATTAADPAVESRHEQVEDHAPHRPGPALAEIHRHARLSVFLI